MRIKIKKLDLIKNNKTEFNTNKFFYIKIYLKAL